MVHNSASEISQNSDWEMDHDSNSEMAQTSKMEMAQNSNSEMAQNFDSKMTKYNSGRITPYNLTLTPSTAAENFSQLVDAKLKVSTAVAHQLSIIHWCMLLGAAWVAATKMAETFIFFIFQSRFFDSDSNDENKALYTLWIVNFVYE